MTPIAKPLTLAEIEDQVKNNNGRLVAVVALPFNQVACSSDDGTLDGLNDIVEQMITTDDLSLGDIAYRVVGFDPTGDAGGILHVEVTVSDVLFW